MKTAQLINAGTDEATYETFVANQRKAIERQIKRGKLPEDTDAAKMAEGVCGMYRHHFRIWTLETR